MERSIYPSRLADSTLATEALDRDRVEKDDLLNRDERRGGDRLQRLARAARSSRYRTVNLAAKPATSGSGTSRAPISTLP